MWQSRARWRDGIALRQGPIQAEEAGGSQQRANHRHEPLGRDALGDDGPQRRSNQAADDQAYGCNAKSLKAKCQDEGDRDGCGQKEFGSVDRADGGAWFGSLNKQI